MKQQAQTNKIEWQKVELGELVSKEVSYPIGDGDHGQIKPSMYQDHGVPYIRVGDMVADKICLDKIVYISEKVHKNNLKSELFPGDVLIAKTGATIGKVAIIPKSIQKANTTSSVGKITPDKNKILPEYLLYFIKTKEFIKQMWLVSIKSAQPGFNIINLKKFKIPLPFSNDQPDLKEQERIVSILEKAEKLKGQSKTAEKLLDEYLKSVFNEMFVGKGFEEIVLGNKEVFDVQSGGTPSKAKKEYWENGTVPWVGSTACKNLSIYESEQFITDKGLKNSSAKLFPKNTVLVALVGATIGKTGLLKFDCATNQNIAGIIIKNDNKINTDYLFFSAKQLYPRFISLSGDTFKMATLSFIRSLKISLPPFPLQQKFSRIVEQVEKMKEEVKKTQKNSEELFNSLMQKAFRGEL